MSDELSMDELFIKQLDDAIENYLGNEQFGVEELASEMGLSRSQLHRKLNALKGKSSSQYIREYRLKKAMQMLQDNVATASEIAYRVGFSSPTYFNTSFKDFYGYTPGEVKFRKPSNLENDQGIQSSNSVSNKDSIEKKSFKYKKYIIGVIVLIIIGTFGYYNYSNTNEVSLNREKESTEVSENSIAVLPFKNMSGDPDNEAFCDGMTAAIISKLSKVEDIKRVISQTSVMSYKSVKKTMPEIAQELNVHYILESGFQKSGNNIKINLQLIDGASDQLFWSQEYEGTYDSIFKIQSEVSELVLKQLNAEVTDREKVEMTQKMTNNIEAYENYLRGKYLVSVWSANKLAAARKYFEKAIMLDSLFVEAYVWLGITYSFQGVWIGSLDKHKADSLAAPYYKRAIEIDPNNKQLISQLGTVEFFNWNFQSADSLYKLLSTKNKFWQTYFFDVTQGRYKQVIKNYISTHKGVSRDPEDFWVAYAYLLDGQVDNALLLINETLKIRPIREQYYDHFGNIFLALKDYDMAKDLLETGLLISDKRHVSMVIHLATVYHYLEEEKKSTELLNEVINRAKANEPNTNVFVAHYYANLGDKDEAFKWLDKAYDKHEVDLIWLKSDPNLMNLKEDPRYQTMIENIGFLDIE